MKSKGVFVVTMDGLYPQDTRAQLICSTLEIGSRVLVNVHKARWPDHHRLAWAVLSKIGDAVGLPAEAILLWLKHETGRCDIIEFPDGKLMPHPQSINFESMSQTDFQQFWKDATVVIQEKIMHRLPPDVFDEVRAMFIGKTDA